MQIRNWLLPVLAVAVLVVLFQWMRPRPVPVSPAPAVSTADATAAVAVPVAPPVPMPKVFEVTVQHGKRVSGPELISVRQGDALILRITSDHDDELHLHGYDLSLQLTKDQPGELHLVADQSGRFEYELHHAHADIGALEVQPQ